MAVLLNKERMKYMDINDAKNLIERAEQAKKLLARYETLNRSVEDLKKHANNISYFNVETVYFVNSEMMDNSRHGYEVELTKQLREGNFTEKEFRKRLLPVVVEALEKWRDEAYAELQSVK